METASGRPGGDPQPVGNGIQAPTVFRAEPTTEKSRCHSDLETRPGEPTGRRNPGMRDRPFDERVPGPMAGRPSPSLETSNPLGREPELVQIPNVGPKREGWLRHILSETRRRIRVRQGGQFRTGPRTKSHGSPDNSARVPGQKWHGSPGNSGLAISPARFKARVGKRLGRL
jgi:hypothetical protein